MTPRNVIRFGGAALCGVGFVLLVATGAIASALGAVPDGVVAGSSDPASSTLWFQLAFMRLFGTTLIGLGAILLWCQSHLTDAQHSSLVKVLGIVLGALALMTVSQQIAIWNPNNAGWVLAGTFLLTAAACGVSTVRAATGRTT
jgi:hypothetical protein